MSEMSETAETVGGVTEMMLGDEGTKAADYANYFVSYAYLYHQKQMLTDERRSAEIKFKFRYSAT